ncbi:hypothetical protein [Nocardioides humi]|uniref:Uncharacterized protein n=1 Tax=Nocardioides humi TaxID=449461 RepID=A0ABN2A9Y2_9ACTN|nr:hypothetical protein [Nocardioides humi]
MNDLDTTFDTTFDTALDTALRRLDPAAPAPTTPTTPAAPPALGERARADLDRILATGPEPTADPSLPVRRHRPRRTRLVACAAAVGLLAGGALLAPALLATGDAAFASWTATPAPLTADEADDAVADCRDMGGPPGDATLTDLAASTLSVAERRGDWTLVLLSGEEGFSALCLRRESWNPFARAGIGSFGRTGDQAPGPRELVATDLGTGGVDGDLLSLAAGAAGAEVAGVSYDSRTFGRVEATVAHGHFALWFPGDELEHASAGVTVEVAYRDGTTGSRTLTLQ